MIKPINAILWPENRKDAVKLFRRYMLTVVEESAISFADFQFQPLEVTRGLIDEAVSDERRRELLAQCWGVIDEKGVRDFSSKNVLLSRLAICLLSPTESDSLDLGEQLSWFVEVLGFLNLDVDKAIDRMQAHFEYFG